MQRVSVDKKTKTRNQTDSPANKLIQCKTYQNEKHLSIGGKEQTQPDMFSCPHYDDDESVGGEPNVVDITDDFDNNS